MRLHQIHEGGFYMGPSGQIRHVCQIHGEYATFVVVDRGRTSVNHTSTPQLGERRTVKVATMASWASKEVAPPRQAEAS